MNETMPTIYEAMTIAQIEAQKELYPDNESIIKILDGYIIIKAQEQAQVKAKEDFGKTITKLIAKLPHPEDVHNVYLAWKEVEVEDTTQDAEEVSIKLEEPRNITNDEGDAITLPIGTEVKELRYPKTKVSMWVVELNKGFQVGRSTGSTASTATKRAITLKKIEGDSLVPSGNFRTGSEACGHLKILLGGDSATRVLQREGYLVQPYDGMDFTVTN